MVHDTNHALASIKQPAISRCIKGSGASVAKPACATAALGILACLSTYIACTVTVADMVPQLQHFKMKHLLPANDPACALQSTSLQLTCRQTRHIINQDHRALAGLGQAALQQPWQDRFALQQTRSNRPGVTYCCAGALQGHLHLLINTTTTPCPVAETFTAYAPHRGWLL